jgi:hypothetical protein
MVGFFQKLFGKKEEIKIVRKKELEQLCRTNVEKELREFSERLKTTTNEITETIRDRCGTLKNAVLKNPNIPVRAKHIMDGNRDAYIKQTLRFIEPIKIAEINTSGKLRSELDTLSQNLTNYTKAIQKSYAVLQEFFRVESEAIFAQLKKLNVLIIQMLQEYDNSACKKYEEILDLLEREEQANQKKKNIDKQRNELNEQLGKFKTDKHKYELDLTKTLKSKEYEELQQLEQKVNSAKMQLKKISAEIHDKLASLSRPLKKYSKITLDTKTVESLLANPVNAIQKENSQKIADVMSSLLKNLEQDKIELKETVKNKAIIVAKQLDLDWFGKIKKELDSVNSKINDYEVEIGKSTVKDDITLLKRKISDCDEKSERLSLQMPIVEDEVDFTKEIKLVLKKLNFELE